MFSRYVGIDYSGAATPETPLSGLRVCAGADRQGPLPVLPPKGRHRHWTRALVAAYCREVLRGEAPAVIGIDHGFSFPATYMARYGVTDWDAFLADFSAHWPADAPGATVQALRAGNARTGSHHELRLCERWTAGAKSVFLFDVQGSVAKSTHAGLPWLRRLRDDPACREKTHFWPFDGFEVPAGKSVVVEVFPSLFRRRYERRGRSPDAHDAFVVAAWLQDMDARDALGRYFEPPLTDAERRQAALEGWILGVG